MRTALVIDASVAVKWFVPEEGSDQADRIAASGRRLLAPRLIATEVANAFWKKARRQLVTPADAAEHLAALWRYFETMLDYDDLIAPALSHACHFDHPIYDFIYLETARRHDALMVTADRRLLGKVAGTSLASSVAHLSDWAVPE